MSEVDDRIVSIQFDNASFERRLEQTLRSLDKLSESLRFSGSQKGIQQVSSAVNGFDPSHMSGAVDGIAKRFTTLGIVGVAAIATLTSAALRFAKNVGGDILSPILTGGKSRAINLEQAKFLFQGIGIDVQQGMDSALKAVKGTAFGLDEAAKIAAQFGASGIKAGAEMTSALRGVAGVAALTGKSFSEIGDIFASSAGTGVVNNQDLLQFATRGLNAADAVGKQLGITQQQVHELASAGKLDFKTFADAMDKAFGKHATEANKTYTGALANMHAAMSRLGASFFTPKLEIQRDLFNAVTPAIDSFAKALLPLINNFIILKRVGTNHLIDFIKNIDFKGISTVISRFANGLINLYFVAVKIGRPIRAAFNSIFPISIIKTLLGLSKSFEVFTKNIKIGANTIDSIKRIFKGFFAGIEIGFAIFKGVIDLIKNVIKAILPAGDGLLSFGTSTGDMIVKLNAALVAGGGIKRFFEALTQAILHPVKFVEHLRDVLIAFFTGINFASSGPIKFLQDLRDKLFSFFGIFSASSAAEVGLNRVSSRIKQLGETWDKVKAAFHKVTDFLQPVLTYMSNWFKSLGHKIAEAFKPGDFNSALDIINIGLLGGIIALLQKFLNGGFKIDLTGGLLDKIRNAFDGLTNTLQAMQTNLKAQALLRIATAVGILVASIVVLSLIDSKALTKALTALSVSFGELIGALTVLDKINFKASILKLNGVAAAMILIAGAAVILSIAVSILARLDLGSLAKGLTGVGVALALLVTATRLISSDAAGLIRAGIAIGIIAGALLLLTASIKIFASMSLSELAKGLTGIGIALGFLVLATNLIAADTGGLIAAGIAMNTMATALLVLAGVVKIFGSMSLAELAKGFLAIAVGLGFMVLALSFITTNTAGLISAGIAMVAISTAILILSKAVKSLGKENLDTLAKGIGAFAAMLLVLVLAVNAMNGAVAGALALIVIAEAIDILAKVLITLGGLSFGDLVHGLIAIAAVLLLLAVASAALEPVIPAMLGLGLALSLIGAGFALFGFGAQQVAEAFKVMAEAGPAGAKAIVEAIKIIITAMPAIELALAKALIHFATTILKAAPLLVRLFQALVEQLLETVIDLAPKMAEAAITVIESFLISVRVLFPDIVQTGIEMLLALLQGIRDNVGDIVNSASDIMINFMDALKSKFPELATHAAELIVTFISEIAKHTGEIVTAGANLLIQLLNGIANNIGRVVTAVANIIIKFITSLADNYVRIVKAGADLLIKLMEGIESNILQVVQKGVHILAKFIEGLGQNISDLTTKGADFIIKLMQGMESNISRVISKGVHVVLKFIEGLGKNSLALLNGAADLITDFLHQLAKAIDKHAGPLRDAGGEVVGAIINGMTLGLAGKAKGVIGSITDFGKKTVHALTHPWDINSPSKVSMALGHSIIEGFNIPFKNDNTAVNNIGTFTSRVTDKFAQVISRVPDILTNMNEFNPTITPVLDLSRVSAASGDIAGMIKVPTLTPDVSLDQARVISSTKREVGSDIPVPEPSITNNKFEQNNYSPTALSTNDIYKNTKSQFALAKEKLGVG